jgi:hypothetical protein
LEKSRGLEGLVGKQNDFSGQTASEAFLWSLIVAQVDRLNQIMTNQEALKKLNVGFSRDIDAALDAYLRAAKLAEN